MFVKIGQGPAWALGRGHSSCLDVRGHTPLVATRCAPVVSLGSKMVTLETETSLGEGLSMVGVWEPQVARECTIQEPM